MTEPANWYEAMAKAIKNREKCQAAIDRWTAALREAEAEMAELGASAPDVPRAAEPPVVEGTAVAHIEGLDVAADPAAEPVHA